MSEIVNVLQSEILSLMGKIDRQKVRIDELEDLVERAQADHLRQTKFHTRVCGDADCYRKALEDALQEFRVAQPDMGGNHTYVITGGRLGSDRGAGYVVRRIQEALKGDE